MSKSLNAVLVRLSISQFCNSREDDSITKEVKTLHKLAGKAGKWVKIKLPEEALSPISKHASRCRAAHYELTLPWIEGYRLLTIAARPIYEAQMAKLHGEFNTHVADFIAKYHDGDGGWIAAAKTMHNGTFNPGDYPDKETCRGQFSFRTEYSPVPQADHFAGVITGQALEKMKADLEQQNQRRIDEAVADLWGRLIAPVAAMAEKLADKDAVFRDSLVHNLDEIANLVPALDVVGDGKLLAAAKEIKTKLASLDPDTLRTSKVIRRAAADMATDICKRFGGLGVRKLAK